MERAKIIKKITELILLNPKSFINSINIYKVTRLFYYLFKASSKERALLIARDFGIKRYENFKKYKTPILGAPDRVFPIFDNIDVSIIVPVYNQWTLTDNCLRSIIRSVKDVHYEVILADDKSTDGTINAKNIFDNLNIICNKKNLGFLLNCNNAVKHAKGHYVMLLNNDTVVHNYWLEALVDKMEKDSKIAICGSKLIYPDGKLQEAGGIIWNDASGWNYGRMDDPAKPEYCYCKNVDYISGASILIKRSFWDEVGGFDERYVPAYYEDTDLAFEAVTRGYKVVFHPHSVLTHFEGQSHGTDELSGTKSYQESNRLKFKDKWQRKLIDDHFNNAENVFKARDKSKNKRTILVIDHYVPWFDKDAGSRSTFLYLKYFIELGYNVKFIGDNFFQHQPYTDYLNEIGVEILYGQFYADNWKDWIKINAGYLDVVYLHRPHIAPKYLSFIRKHTSAKIVYQCHDLHHIRIQRDFENTEEKKLHNEAKYWEQVEKEIFNTVDVGVTFSHDEKLMLDSYNLNAEIRQIPLFLYDEIQQSVASFQERDGIMFVGGFSHKPNEEGVNWFIKEVYPLITAVLPDSLFYIVGSNISDDIVALESHNVSVLGFISDDKLLQLYKKVKINILPLLHGAGVKGKLIESMQQQTPVVSTSIGIEGINAKSFDIKGYDNPSDFSSEVLSLLTDENYWKKVQSKFTSAFDLNFSKVGFQNDCKEIF